MGVHGVAAWWSARFSLAEASVVVRSDAVDVMAEARSLLERTSRPFSLEAILTSKSWIRFLDRDRGDL